MLEHDRILRPVCQRLVREGQAGRELSPAARWLVDNYGFLRTQSRDLREALSSRFWRKLTRVEEAASGSPQEPRIYRLAKLIVEETRGKIAMSGLSVFLEYYQHTAVLTLAELWSVRPVLKLALMDLICAVVEAGSLENSQASELIPNAITSLRVLDQGSFHEFVESLSAVDAVLREDPSGAYPAMDFETRDDYRRAVEEIAERSWNSEVEVARLAIDLARNVDSDDPRHSHVGFYLLGPGCQQLRILCHHGLSLHEALRDLLLRYPNLFYIGGVVLLTGFFLRIAAATLAGPWWILALLIVPLSQLAMGILNPLVGLTVSPTRRPRFDYSQGIPDDCRTFLVVPTLLLSQAGVEELLERIEIHYLANRDRNLLLGLLTDLPDASTETTDKDHLVGVCAEGIRALNDRYRSRGVAPFYLFHRPRLWNASEGVWMGYERKRGKLEDFNHFLLGVQDPFTEKVGDLEAIQKIRYVITLDTDTHLPRDSARELVATMAHPLNQPVFHAYDVVREGYGLLQPRVSISMESARRSRLASIFSGQTGLDPYTKAVSDLYQDLHGQATYTGKGIYDLAAFDRATRQRFPDNTLLSHDLIEGEHVRVGLVTDLEVVDDFPTTYEAYSKRKHRWVRGDWQIARWLLPDVPDARGKMVPNPLPVVSLWKIFDNLRRSLYEVSLVLFFLVGMFATGRALRYSIAVVAVLVVPALAQMFFGLLRFPPRRFLRSFLREIGLNFLLGLAEACLTITFLLYQALLMTDAIVRTLVRTCITKRKLLEWESMAEAESAGSRLSLVSLYLLMCPAIATAISFFAARAQTGYELLPIAVLLLWAATPLASEFVSRRARKRKRKAKDLRFLRDLALRTWHYFVDFGRAEENWLVPDNVQFEPHAVAARTSPTNIGIQLVVNLAASEFGYSTVPEAATNLRRIFASLDRLERFGGHFYNWYDTRTLQPLHPRYVSAVDSGNLAAALITVKQGCLDALHGPLLSTKPLLAGLRDYCARIQNSLPHSGRSAPALCKPLEDEPSDLFAWADLLSDLEKTELKRAFSEEAHYWHDAFLQRVRTLQGVLAEFVPWTTGPLGKQVRAAATDARLASLMKMLRCIPKIDQLEADYMAIGQEIRSCWDSVSPSTRQALEGLLLALDKCHELAQNLAQTLAQQAAGAQRLFEEMDFRFLLDRVTNLLHIGFNVETRKLDSSYYDLLASEARTAVFVAVAKGDIPRESWFRLGRKLTTFQGYRTLLSWSGTMFEYLMPGLFLRNFEDSLLAASAAGAVRIQQIYCHAKGVPWGVSEAAYSARDAALNYQYRAFGIPALGLSQMRPEDLVVAPYASMLALMVEPVAATRNLRHMAARGWVDRYGFYESVDYTAGRPVLVKAYMVHHQGMSFLALANSLLDNSIQRWFHAEPIVLATQLLLQERLPALVEAAEAEEHLRPEQERGRPMVAVGQET